MSTLAEFHTMVGSVVNRGIKYDTDIVTQTRLAAAWIERNYTLKYMELLEAVSISEDDTSLTFTALNIKSIDFIRLDLADRKVFMHQMDPKDSTDIGSGLPEAYWISGSPGTIYFNTISDDDYTGQARVNVHTTWPTADGATNWLLSYAEDLLLAQALIYLSPVLRDPRLQQQYKPIKDEAIRTLLLADEELRRLDGSHHMGMYIG